VVTGSEDETLRLWSAADGRMLAEMQYKHESGVASIAVSPAEPLIASGSGGGRILLWDAHTGALLRPLVVGDVPWKIRSLSFSHDGQWLMSASGDGCRIFNVATGRELDEAKQLRLSCNAAIYSPDGRLAAASYNADVTVMDTRPNLAIRTKLRSSGVSIHRVGFARDGQSIAWGGYPGTVAPEVMHRLRLPLDGKPLTRVEGIPAQEDRKSYLQGGHKHDPWSVYNQGSWSVEVKEKADACCFLDLLKDGKLQTEIKIDGTRPGRGIALLPDQETILLGTTAEIRAYDLIGRYLLRHRPTPVSWCRAQPTRPCGCGTSRRAN
jgi:hypothetical protein